jgi:uncharacterized protein (TIGR03435 family)
MLRSLLAQRFALKLRPDRRELDHFTLTLVRAAGATGPYMVRMPDDCDATAAKAARSGMPQRGALSAFSTLAGECVPVSGLLSSFEQFLDTIVVDKTGLSGKWTWEVVFDSDRLLAHEPGLPPLAVAVQEQLGLKLTATHGPVDVLVIDHVGPPTED